MKESRFSEEQIIGFLKRAEAGLTARSCVVHTSNHCLFSIRQFNPNKYVATQCCSANLIG